MFSPRRRIASCGIWTRVERDSLAAFAKANRPSDLRPTGFPKANVPRQLIESVAAHLQQRCNQESDTSRYAGYQEHDHLPPIELLLKF